MNKMMLVKPYLMMAAFSAAVVGCGASDGGSGSPNAGAQEKPLSIAEQFVAKNTRADSDLHLVARKYLNNGTEVAMFHEPVAGHVMFSIAGSPLGHSVLNRDLIEGKTASELWTLVAPGEPVPETLAQAIERSKNPAPMSEAPTEGNAKPADPQSGAPAPGSTAQDAGAATQTNGEMLLSGGYCVGQFWADWANIGNGAQRRDSEVMTWGWHDQPYNGITGSAQFAACPLGNVSNLGGVLTVDYPNGTTTQYNLPPDYFLVTAVWTAGLSCGYDVGCAFNGYTRCTPQGFHFEARFDSMCFLYYGSSCGDKFDWISWASTAGSFCE